MIQTDLDEFMARYNYKRTNQGKHCKGRTPAQTLEVGYDLYKKYVIDGTEVTEKIELVNQEKSRLRESCQRNS